MNTKLLIFICIAVLLAISVLCVFCPVMAMADSPADEFPAYSKRFFKPAGQHSNYLGDTAKTELLTLIEKAYQCNLFGGSYPILAGLSNSAVATGTGSYENFFIVYTISTYANSYDNVTKPDLSSLTTDSSGILYLTFNTGSSSAFYVNKHILLSNGTYLTESSEQYKNTSTSHYYVNTMYPMIYFNGNTSALEIVDTQQSPLSYGVTAPTGDLSINVSQLIGAYDRILAGSTVGGDGYDDGYAAGYEDGYDEGYGDGRGEGFTAGRESGYNDGYSVGYDLGYETGFDDGWETGFTVGRDQGYDEGHSAGYNEGFDIGYETGYDDGYDDGYEYGELVASPITIDLPSVITSVPQSAKSIINNAFGFELFGINVAGLLSVLLIVAIIGFVVKWLMSR